MNLKIFKRKKKRETRAAPAVFTRKDFPYYLENGYTKLSSCPEVVTACERQAELVGSMTLQMWRNTETGSERITYKDPEIGALAKKIDVDPCTGMTRKGFVEYIVMSLLLYGDGNAYVLPRYTQDGYLENLIPLNPADVSVISDASRFTWYYVHNGERYEPGQLIHFRLHPRPDEPWRGRGYSVPMREIVNSLKLEGKTKKSFLTTKYVPSLIVRMDADEDYGDEEQGALLDSYIHNTEAGQPWMVGPEVASIEQIRPLTLDDIALSDQVELDRKALANLLGVPPYILGVGEYSEDEYNNFINTRIMSIAQVIQQTLTEAIFLSPDNYLKFSPKSLYTYKIETLAQVGKDLHGVGVMTGNEVREWVGLGPMEGLDELIQLENYIPSEMAGSQKKLKGGSDGQIDDTPDQDNGD